MAAPLSKPSVKTQGNHWPGSSVSRPGTEAEDERRDDWRMRWKATPKSFSLDPHPPPHPLNIHVVLTSKGTVNQTNLEDFFFFCPLDFCTPDGTFTVRLEGPASKEPSENTHEGAS